MLSFALIEFIVAVFFCVGLPVFLIVYFFNKSKRKPTEIATPATVSSSNIPAIEAKQAPAPKPKQKNPYIGLQIMLLVGSLFLVTAVISFTHNADDSLVAPVAIALTLLFYAIGFYIRKKVEYLKIVGRAFLYVSLAIFPFWIISFNFFGMSMHGAWMLSSVITLVMLTVTALAFDDRILAGSSLLWVYVTIWSFMPEIESTVEIPIYWVIASSALISLVPTFIVKMKPSWLPLCYRKPMLINSNVAEILVVAFTIIAYLEPDTLRLLPFLRTVVMICFLIWTLLTWSIKNVYGWFILSRFIAQFLLFTVVADSLNYSFFDGLRKADNATQLAIIITLLVGALAQNLIALFIPKPNKEVEKNEHFAECVSIAVIFCSLFFSFSMADPAKSIIGIIICAIIATLGIAYTVMRKKVAWTLATMVALFVIPLIISNGFGATFWNDWANLAYFAAMTAIALASYKTLSRINENDAYGVVLSGLIFYLGACILASSNVHYIEIGWLASAIALAGFGYLTKRIVMYEFSIYAGALCLFALTGTVGDAFLPKEAMRYANDCAPFSFGNYYKCSTMSRTESYTNWIAGINIIRSLILGCTLLAVSFLKERDLPEKRRWRFTLSYIVTTIGLYSVGATAGHSWMIFCIAAQVFYLMYGALHDLEWLVWTAIIVMPISALSLTGGFNYIWFFMLGLILIGVVIWRLSKINKAREKVEDSTKSDEKKIEETPKAA